MDVGSDLSMNPNAPLFSTLLDKKSSSELYPTIQYRPDRAWTQELLQHRHSSSSLGDFTQSASLLHENYGLLLQPKLTATDAFYALNEMFTFAAHSERQFLNLMQSKITRELDVLSNSDVAPSLSNLIYSKRVLTRHIHRLKENVLAIETKGGLTTETILDLEWPQAKGDVERRHVKVVAHTLFRDFKHLLFQAEALSEQCDRGMTVSMNSAMIAESKRAIKQAEGVGKLTFLAFLYIPLSFTASFFGMNFHQLGTGTLSIWVWFVASCLVTAVTFLFLWLSTGSLGAHLAQATSCLRTRFRRI
jgi:Mg2+ and Co2+ transporter CorA